MTHRIALALSTAALLAGASAARAQSLTSSSVVIEGFGGWQNLQLSRGSVGQAISGDEGTAIVGGDLLLRGGLLGVGVLVDKTVNGNAQPWAGSILAGFLIDPLPALRVELLGELGRRARDFGDLFSSTGSTMLGLRPGVSFRLAAMPIRLGVSGIVRWPWSGGDVGSPDYGFVGRVGFEFP